MYEVCMVQLWRFRPIFNPRCGALESSHFTGVRLFWVYHCADNSQQDDTWNNRVWLRVQIFDRWHYIFHVRRVLFQMSWKAGNGTFHRFLSQQFNTDAKNSISVPFDVNNTVRRSVYHNNAPTCWIAYFHLKSVMPQKYLLCRSFCYYR